MLEKTMDVTNMISTGTSEEDLYLTFAFVQDFPELSEGSPEAAARSQQMRSAARGAVQKTIDVIRQMVVDGKIQ
jgi:hypothetical protein